MARFSKDPTLSGLAHEAGAHEFTVALSPEHRAALRLKWMEGRKHYLGINMIPGGQTYAVSVYIGRKNHILGWFTPSCYEAMFRYADAAKLYFWKYRVMVGKAEPDAKQFNISAVQAKADLADNNKLLKLLEKIEAHLLAHKLIPTPEELAAMRAKLKQPRAPRQPIRQLLESFMKRLDERMARQDAEATKRDELLAHFLARENNEPKVKLNVSREMQNELNDIERRFNLQAEESRKMIELLKLIAERLNTNVR